MGDINQKNFIQAHKSLIEGPILEVGGKDYGSTQKVRDFFSSKDKYVSADMEAGPGVDVVVDFTHSFEVVERALPVKRFRTIINFSVLEHCRNPFEMCQNLSELLEPGGLIFISAPFAWHIHAFPSDYWRFTPDGIKALFPALDFDLIPGNISMQEGQLLPLEKLNFYLNFNGLREEIRKKRLSRLSAVLIFVCMKLHIMPEVFRHKMLFPSSMVNMVGKKR